MKRSAFAFAILLGCIVTSASDPPKRPRIFGIAYVRILVTNVDKARDFYSLALHSIAPSNDAKSPCDWCERAPVSLGMGKKRLGLIELKAIRVQDSPSLLSEVAFRTDDVRRLRDSLLKNQFAAEKLTKCGDDPCFGTIDPDQHRLIFVQKSDNSSVGIPVAYSSIPIRSPIIHTGFVVHDRAAEERFYKDILGFHVYWYGGKKDDETSWVDMQVPDGTDWIEYMLNVSANADHHTLGVMNHIALGVPDIPPNADHNERGIQNHFSFAVEQIKPAVTRLRTHGLRSSDEPEIGRDGKWSYDIYDPDMTRVEFMEFKPAQPPCCNPYTGPQPHP